MEVVLKNEGRLSANNMGVSIAAKMTNDEKVQAYIEKLEAENERLKLVVDNIETDVINVIRQFWCWYNSGSYKRDFRKMAEGEKYARDFIKDLIKELSEG